jgi:hypothetical protein
MQNSETLLCKLAEKYGSDKCPRISHSYTPLYHQLFEGIRDEVRTVLEIGVGNVPLMAPIVGSSYSPGASLRMWRDYFENARIIGCDIRPEVLFEEVRIETFLVDQSKRESLLDLVQQIGVNQFDFIIDDGSHIEKHMINSFQTLWPYVQKGGTYIIEDIKRHSVQLFASYKPTDGECTMIHHGLNTWDAFIAFRKK